ncbi:DNA-binding domain-containing protein [Roseovarius arcticus]|uniref:HvfC/BufC N-terminal domain-containing protein n=1 Tax=Roseovarius arcticus TaxID=2547404 RepID=UPI0011100C60|nr:DNA-binding domain-containing protein [Roseovarius arcticus]
MSDQTTFRTALLDAEKPVPPGLGDGRGGPAGARFDVYRNNVASSLIDALEAGFPAVQKLIGPTNFRAIMGVFVRQHPPIAPMIAVYGAALPGFLEQFPPLAHLAYLPDVARLEQALRESYHSADCEPLDPASLQSLAPEALLSARITLSPALRIIRSRWPVHAIWAYNMQADAPKPTGAPQDVIVTRPAFDPQMAVAGPGGAAFAAGLASGATVSAAHDAALAEAPDFDLPAILGILIAGHALHNLKSGGAP